MGVGGVSRGWLLAGTESRRSSEEQPVGRWSVLLVAAPAAPCRQPGGGRCFASGPAPLPDDPGRALSRNNTAVKLDMESSIEMERLLLGLAVLLGFPVGGQNVQFNSENDLYFGKTQLEIISVAIPLVATRCRSRAVDTVLLTRARPDV